MTGSPPIPKSRIKNVPTDPLTVTCRERGLSGSLPAVTTTLDKPLVNPFIDASARAAVMADGSSPGR